MRKMFTKLFGLTLLMYLVSSFTVAQAQTCDLTLSQSDVVLLTDITTVCDSDLIQYAVTGFPDSTYYNFNSIGGDTTAAGFTLDSTFFVKEGVGFTVQVRYNGTCYSNVLTYPGEDLIQPVYIDTLLLTQPQCFDDQGELTVVVGGTESFLVNFVDSLNWRGEDPTPGYPLYNGSQFQAEPGKKYYVRVQSANGCTSLGWDSISVNNAPNPLVIDDVNTNIDTLICVGDTAMVTVEGISGGTAPYYVTLSGAGMDMMDTLAMAGTDTFYVTMPGTYTATVVDSFGCDLVSDSMAVIVGPEEITFDIALDDVSCADSATGAIYVFDMMGGASGSFTATLVGADTSMIDVAAVNDTVTFDGLSAGYYSVWVKDAACALDSTAYDNPNGTGNVISVQSPGEVELTVLIDTALCIGDSSMIMASATGGSGTYEFSANGGSWIPAESDGTYEWTVPAGTYDIVVRDGASCELAWPTITLTDPDTVVINSVDTISPTCPGGNDGVINVTASGGVGTLWYSLDSVSWKTNNIFAVFAGDYTVYVRTDACENDVEMMDVTVPALDTNVIEITNIDSIQCYGAGDGSISVDVVSWAQQTTEVRNIDVYYSMNVDDAYVTGTMMDSVAPWQYVADDLEAGTYYIWAVDDLGCVFDACACGTPDVLTAVITEAEELTVSGTVTGDASCYGNYDGVMTIYATEGVTHYGHANTLQAATNLPDGAFTAWPAGADSVNIQVGKGTYYVVVKDDCGDKAIDGPFVVGGLDPVMITDTAALVTGIQCFGDTTGVIEVFAAEGGTEELVYTLQMWEGGMWHDVDGYVEVTETMYENLPADTFKVVVTDLGGCDGDETDWIIVPGPASGVEIENFDYEDITCYGASDGLIMIEAQGGTAPYQFKVGTTNWRDFPAGDSTKNIVATEPGMFIVWVRDAEGCVSDPDTAWIDEPEDIMLTVTGTDVTAGSCATPDGEIEVMVYGGNTNVFDIYIPGLDTVMGVADSAETFTNVPAGTYTVWAMEVGGNDCYAMEDVTITSPDSLAAVATVLDSVGCYGAGGGEILVEVTGGDAPYSVQLPGVDTLTGDSVVFSDLMAGTYTITVVDASSCSYTLGTIEISQSDSITLNATFISDITCDAEGQFSLQADGGSGDFWYYAAISKLPEHILVPDPEANPDMWQADSIFTVTEPGTYIVWVYDVVNHCIVGGEEWNGAPVNEWRVKIAEPEVLVEVNAEVVGNTACYGATFDIVVPADSVMVWEDGVVVADPVYTVMIDTVMGDTLSGVGPGTYVVTVTHESGCFGTDTVVIAEQEVFEVVLDKGDGEFSCPDVVEGYLEATVVSGGGDTLEYQLWQDGALKTDYQPENSFLVRINHDYVVVVKDENGCTDTSNVMVLDPVERADFAVKDVTCYGDTLASAKIMVTGEEGRMFKLHWLEIETGVNGVTDYFMGDTILSQFFAFDEKNVTDRHYELWVEDSEGCPSVAQELTFKRVDGPLQVVNVADTVGDCATTFSFEIAGGTAPYMVMVDDDVVADSIGFYERISLDLSGGEHKVYVFDAQECELEYNFDLEFGTVVYDSVQIYVGDTAHYMDHGLDTMLVGGDYEFILSDTTGCATQLFVNVHERVRTAPVLDTMSPMDTIADNHPTFVITFSDDVTVEEMGYLWVFVQDSTDASLQIEITSDMVSGNTVTVTYDYDGTNGLLTNTTYVVKVDSGVIMGDGLVWDGIMDDSWTFTTGDDWATSIAPDIEELDFKVYPNPFNNFIRIDNAEKLDRVLVSNIAGQRVLDIENPTYEIRTGNLVTGVYVVTLISNDEIVKSERIIKR